MATHNDAGFVDGACVLLVSGLLAYVTTRFVENPLRYRAQVTISATAAVPLGARFRRPTIVVGSAIALLAVSSPRVAPRRPARRFQS